MESKRYVTKGNFTLKKTGLCKVLMRTADADAQERTKQKIIIEKKMI